MYNPTEQFTEFNKVNVAQASKLAAIAIGNAEKLVRLGMNTARFAVEQSLESTKAIAGVTRDFRGQAHVRIKGKDENLAVSRIYSHLFRQM